MLILFALGFVLTVSAVFQIIKHIIFNLSLNRELP